MTHLTCIISKQHHRCIVRQTFAPGKMASGRQKSGWGLKKEHFWGGFWWGHSYTTRTIRAMISSHPWFSVGKERTPQYKLLASGPRARNRWAQRLTKICSWLKRMGRHVSCVLVRPRDGGNVFIFGLAMHSRNHLQIGASVQVPEWYQSVQILPGVERFVSPDMLWE